MHVNHSNAILHDIGRNIRRLRQAKGLSQESLAEHAELHRTYVGGVERGERNVTLLSLERIAVALEVELVALLGRQA
jgi:transcriptional regulator with XRE-family HTH domain